MKAITALICTILGDLRSEGGDLVVAFRGSFFRFLLGSEPELFAHSIDEFDNSPMVFAMAACDETKVPVYGNYHGVVKS